MKSMMSDLPLGARHADTLADVNVNRVRWFWRHRHCSTINTGRCCNLPATRDRASTCSSKHPQKGVRRIQFDYAVYVRSGEISGPQSKDFERILFWSSEGSRSQCGKSSCYESGLLN